VSHDNDHDVACSRLPPVGTRLHWSPEQIHNWRRTDDVSDVTECAHSFLHRRRVMALHIELAERINQKHYCLRMCGPCAVDYILGAPVIWRPCYLVL
jgi:hypothetical protein